MAHFATDDKMNIFRLPTGWQFLVNNVLGGTLNAANFAQYDSLVQACLATGAYCILDVRCPEIRNGSKNINMKQVHNCVISSNPFH